MANLIFSDAVYVEIQGDRVMRFGERYADCVQYTIIGFQEDVILRDFRPRGLEAIDYVLDTQDTSRFAADFNGIAQANIFDLTNDEPMLIELRDVNYTDANYLLWIAIEFNGQIPIREYEIGLVQKMGDAHYALLAVFEVDKDELEINSHYSSSGASSKSSSALAVSSPLPLE